MSLMYLMRYSEGLLLHCKNMIVIVKHTLKHLLVISVYCLHSESAKLSALIYPNTTLPLLLWNALLGAYFENLLNTCANS